MCASPKGMGLQHVLLAVCLAPLSTAVGVHGRGSASNTSAPSTSSTISIHTTPLNTSSTTTPFYHSSSPLTAFPSRRLTLEVAQTGLRGNTSHRTAPDNTTDSTNASCTVHVLGANIGWWFPMTFYHQVATMTTTWGNYSNPTSFTFVPQTTSFNFESALENEFVCTWESITVDQWTGLDCITYDDHPTAASTAIVTRSAFPPIPAEVGFDDAWAFEMDFDALPSPTTAISISPGSMAEASMPTPFVQVTAYELERAGSTETLQLSSAYLQPYREEDIVNDATATGPMPDGFMDMIPYSTCVVGNFQAIVTVIVFVDLTLGFFPLLGTDRFIPAVSATGWDVERPWDVETALDIMNPTAAPLRESANRGWDFLGTGTGPAEPEATEAGDPALLDASGDVMGIGAKIPQDQARTVGTLGTAPVVMGPSSVVVIGSQTLRPGDRGVAVGGTLVTLATSASAIVIGGSSLPLHPSLGPDRQLTVGTLGTLPVVVGPSSGLVIGSQTVQAGGAAVTIGPGTTVSLVDIATALVVGKSSSILPQVGNPTIQAAAPPVLTIGTKTFVPNAATQFFMDEQTLTPGGTAVVDGTEVRLGPSADFVVIGSSTQILPSSGTAPAPVNDMRPELVFGGSTFTALPPSRASSSPDASNFNNPQNNQNSKSHQDGEGPSFVILGQTLLPGGAPITISASTLSLAPSGSFLVIDGSTTTLATPAAVAPAHITAPPLTIGNGVFRPLPGTGTTYQIGDSLLTPGGSVVVADTTISLAAGATALVVNGLTTILSAKGRSVTTNPPILTIGSQTYTAVSETLFIVRGQTLTPGGTITVDGTTIVLSPQATELIYGSSGRSTSTALFPATTTRGTRTTASASASTGYSGERPAAATTTSRGGASQIESSLVSLFGGIFCMGWLVL